MVRTGGTDGPVDEPSIRHPTGGPGVNTLDGADGIIDAKALGQVTPGRNRTGPLASPARTEAARATRNATELFVHAVGRQDDGRPVRASRSFVFLHGLGGTQVYWTAADGESHLPPGSTLVDLLGFGRSPRPLIRYTLETHLAALEPVLVRRAPFILVGHSLGAALALAYAARHPSQVAALVLISLPSYGGPKGAIRWFRRSLRGWFLTNMVLTALVCVATRRLLGPILPMLIRDVPREVARDMVEHNFMSSTTSLWNVLYRRDVALDLDALPEDLPVMFIHGTDDATAPIDAVRRLVDGRAGRQLIELTGVDHHPWLRNPAECAELITATGRLGRLPSADGGSGGRWISSAAWGAQNESCSSLASGLTERELLAGRRPVDLPAGTARRDGSGRNRRRRES
ncbi:MAG TPA: alpha/beta hydrolase [Actinobacteria bacterium]|nr:alpha/beta hydrolase [Actinomycetota bacterium]